MAHGPDPNLSASGWALLKDSKKFCDQLRDVVETWKD